MGGGNINLSNNQLFTFWRIGKMVYELQDNYENVIKKISDYCSYYYGNSFLYTRENIKYMKLFYLSFPIFYKQLENISWEQYKILLLIENKKERFFYFQLSLFFNSDIEETRDFIQNDYYLRI